MRGVLCGFSWGDTWGVVKWLHPDIVYPQRRGYIRAWVLSRIVYYSIDNRHPGPAPAVDCWSSRGADSGDLPRRSGPSSDPADLVASVRASNGGVASPAWAAVGRVDR